MSENVIPINGYEKEDEMVYCCPRCDNNFFFMIGEKPGLAKVSGFQCSECDLAFYFRKSIPRAEITSSKKE